MFIVVSLPASAQSRSWAASGGNEQIVLTDCRDCGDDIGMMVSCQGAERPAGVIVHWAAVEDGQEGALLPIVLTIDDQTFERQATTRYFGQIGYTPEFPLERGDPLIAALQSGYRLKVSFSGQTTELALRGSHSAFEIFKAHCGWNQTATSSGSDAKWFVQTYPAEDSGRSKTFLSYGIPETDAIAFSASCESDRRGPELAVDLLIDAGTMVSGQSADVDLQGPDFRATYAGRIFEESSEYAGIRLAVGIDDALWQVFFETGELLLQAGNSSPTTLPLQTAERPTQEFLNTCRAYFNAYDAVATEQDSAGYLYGCEDGSQLRVRYDNSRSYSVAHISHDGQPEVSLLEAISASGAKYTNGHYTLHTQAGDALLTYGETVYRCHSEE